MSICYEFDVSAVCPVDGTRDEYRAEIRTNEQINVEHILAHADGYHSAVIYQERLTTCLHAELGITGSLTTVGMHSGVRVTVTVES